MRMKIMGAAGATLCGAVMLTTAVSAAPLMASGASLADTGNVSMIEQIQYNRRGWNGNRGNRGGYAYRRGGRGIGVGAAVLGLGVLGAAAAAGGAYCYRRQAVVDPYYGHVVGYRNVYVC